MDYNEFVGKVQHRARLSSREQAERATRATLQTFAERLTEGAAQNLSSQLPADLAQYLQQREGQQTYTLDEFFEQVREREGVELPEAVFHSRAVFDVLREATSEGAMDNVMNQLPDDFQDLILSGSEGDFDVRD